MGWWSDLFSDEQEEEMDDAFEEYTESRMSGDVDEDDAFEDYCNDRMTR